MKGYDFKKNIFTLSAELGVPFGILLSLESIVSLFSDKVPLLGHISLLIFLGAPVVLCLFQRKRYVATEGFASFSELWTLAIFTSLGGALIMALVTYLAITFLRPNALYEQMQYIIDNFAEIDKDMAKTLKKMIEKEALPTPIDYSMMKFWLIASLGCLGGSLTSFIACKIPLRKKDAKDNNLEQ